METHPSFKSLIRNLNYEGMNERRGIEIMRRNKDVILGEHGYSDRGDNTPRNIVSLIGLALKILKSVSPSPTRAIEMFQEDRNKALRLFAP